MVPKQAYFNVLEKAQWMLAYCMEADFYCIFKFLIFEEDGQEGDHWISYCAIEVSFHDQTGLLAS